MAKRQWYDIKAKDDSTDIFIYDVIGEDWFGGVSAKQFIDDLNSIKTPSINVHLNTPGGDVFDGTAMYNALVGHDAHITTSIEGQALSMGSILAMAGDERLMADNSMMMIHNPWTIAAGDADEFRKTADVLDKTKLNLLSVYIKNSDLESDEISTLMDDETWMIASEAFDRGFITEITGEVKLAACFDKKVYAGFKHTPESILKQEIPEPQGRKIAIARLRTDLI